LWQKDRVNFRSLSGRAAVYFEKGYKPEIQIERIYHLVVIYPAGGIKELQKLVQKWINSTHRTELESLFTSLQQQIKLNRTTESVEADTIYWNARTKYKFHLFEEAFKMYSESLVIYHKLGNRIGEANTLRGIGDVLQALQRNSEAIKQYDEAITIYREIGDRLGEVNILEEIVDISRQIVVAANAENSVKQSKNSPSSHSEVSETTKIIHEQHRQNDVNILINNKRVVMQSNV